MQTFLENITKFLRPRIFVYAGLIIFLVIFYKATMQRGSNLGYIIAAFPLIAIGTYLLIKKPLWSFIILFVCNYLISGFTRYYPLPIPISLLMDALIACAILTLLIKTTYEKVEWKRIYNPLALIISIWLLYCILELLNLNRASLSDWSVKVRSMSFYPLIMVIMVSVLITKYKQVKLLLLLWAILTILAALKGYWQKNHGFDATELRWLYVEGGYRTHLISTGVRYFSFFTDAGNYGSCMGFSMVIFSIAAIYIKKHWLKGLYIIAGLAGAYGMIISGTRGALIVPFAGFAFFVILSKKIKIALSTIILIITSFCFLNFTTIGENNALIRRMRSAFDKNDPSLNVRLENQKRLKEHLKDIPFGAGIGFGNTRDINNPDYEFMAIPRDSWFVNIWVQTGVVGLSLYVLVLFSGIIWGGYIIFFKIKNKELRGILAALLAGVVGMTASAYGNELLGQYPNCYLYFISFAVVFMGQYYDKELLEKHELLT